MLNKDDKSNLSTKAKVELAVANTVKIILDIFTEKLL